MSNFDLNATIAIFIVLWLVGSISALGFFWALKNERFKFLSLVGVFWAILASWGFLAWMIAKNMQLNFKMQYLQLPEDLKSEVSRQKGGL
jgi:type VI protein secretion system component VasK